METDGMAPVLFTLSTTKIELVLHSRAQWGPWTLWQGLSLEKSQPDSSSRMLVMLGLPQPDKWMDGWHIRGWRPAQVFVGWIPVEERWGDPWSSSSCWTFLRWLSLQKSPWHIHNFCKPGSFDFWYQTTAKQDCTSKKRVTNICQLIVVWIKCHYKYWMECQEF